MFQVFNLRNTLIARSSRLIRDNSLKVFFSSSEEVFVVFVRENFFCLIDDVDIDNKECNKIDDKSFVNDDCEKDK